MSKQKHLGANEVASLLRLNEATGEFTWKVARMHVVKPGDVAGRTTSKGYRVIKINGAHYMAHRLVWLLVHGGWPVKEIDHINGIKTDNRPSNLRQVTTIENSWNRHQSGCRSKTGVLGVRKLPSGRFWASITRYGKKISLGTFDFLADASAAYQCARSNPDLHRKPIGVPTLRGSNLPTAGLLGGAVLHGSIFFHPIDKQ